MRDIVLGKLFYFETIYYADLRRIDTVLEDQNFRLSAGVPVFVSHVETHGKGIRHWRPRTNAGLETRLALALGCDH